MECLEKKRHEIEEIDAQLFLLVKRRMEIVSDIARIKKENGIAVFDKSREDALLRKVEEACDDERMRMHYLDLYKELMNVSKAYQHAYIEEE